VYRGGERERDLYRSLDRERLVLLLSLDLLRLLSREREDPDP
jgi:hypothetical protein